MAWVGNDAKITLKPYVEILAQQIAASNAGWPFQFRFAVHIVWSRVPELWTLDDTRYMKSTIPDFKGKVLSIVLKGVSWTRAIQDPHFELQYGRLFLVGTSPNEASTRDWIAGSRYAVAWDSVMDYAVFDSLDEYVERLHAFDGRKKKRSKTKKD